MMCLRVSYKKKYGKSIFCIWRKGTDPRVGSGSVSQRYGSADLDPHQNVTDPQHWFWTYSLKSVTVGGWGRGCWPRQIGSVSMTVVSVRSDPSRFCSRILVYSTDRSSCPPFLLLDLSWTTTAPAWPRVRWTPASGSATSRPRLVESISRSNKYKDLASYPKNSFITF